MRKTRSLRKLRRLKLKLCSPAQTDINTDYSLHHREAAPTQNSD
jgi:hypothetical protein